MSGADVIILVGGGLAAGVINSLAGGGSLLTVPLLVLAGLPGTVANGTNRIGVLTSNATATAGFHRLGVSGLRTAVPVLVPTALGSVVGAVLVGRLADEQFERTFGLVMIPLLVLALRRPRPAADGGLRPWPPGVVFVVFLLIGLYGGAFQAGVGLILVLALSHAGYDLVMANSIKVVVILVLTAIAIPVFVVNDQIAWAEAFVLAAGFAAGGWLGAHVAVRGGEKVIRPVLAVAVLALAGRMLGLY